MLSTALFGAGLHTVLAVSGKGSSLIRTFISKRKIFVSSRHAPGDGYSQG